MKFVLVITNMIPALMIDLCLLKVVGICCRCICFVFGLVFVFACFHDLLFFHDQLQLNLMIILCLL